ncbi:hypothetical protein OSB04_015397 [Centaurea solstitialis]|uniref:TIR domain-containing protein n=1 Tax=Centaurea solstitialis TaxID=347529 RepID=A0AA38TH73_9ASTR|nr:hypothetical protein OSB04_015397 [Centaurea solstitialis]
MSDFKLENNLPSLIHQWLIYPSVKFSFSQDVDLKKLFSRDSMAASSTSSVQRSFKYDVFLSFRGEDTRNTFIGHLYNALQHKSILTYKDDERIQKGEKISDELMKSIKDSRFHIIVFSKNYASSSWCLEELVQIIECQKTVEQTAYPVFYDVEPSEVRKQSGEFGEVFAKHEKEEAVGKWRKALEEAAGLAGWELKNTVDGNEAKFIQKIVEEISLELRSNNFSIDEKLVGMEARIRDVVSALEIGLDNVRMIGIKGMGGAGKTTLARAVFDHISFMFEGSSFVENVRENSNPNFSGLKKLQKQVLKDVLNDRGIKISNVHDGKKMIKKMMCCRKVLVVIDDVDHIEQLKALAGELNWFNEGSRIIITTRDEQVLVAYRVNLILDVNLLSHHEAICLFSRYAFGRESPIQGYIEPAGQVVGYAAGLPLTITVLGSFLCGKNELEWEDAIRRLKTIPLKDTLDKLEISYIGLEEEHKEIFLDIACILKGWHKEVAIRALESCGFFARIGLRVLEQKSLITISRYGELSMHDHIEEMGKNIVRRFHPNEPKRHNRLWIDEEIKDILADNQGTNEAIRCIKLLASERNLEIVMKGLGNMKQLRLLHVLDKDSLKKNRKIDEDADCFHNDWKLDEGRDYFPNTLRWLSWEGYPFRSLPKSFQANNLVALEMGFSNIVQLWEYTDRKVLNKLRFLDLKYSKLKNLDLGLTPNLERLSLIGCSDYVELHMLVECPKLIYLDLGASTLMTLDLRGTPNIEKLDLYKCVDLVELHIPVECLNLLSININGSKLRTLDLRRTPNIEKLHLDECVDLEELYIPFECLKIVSIYINVSKLRSLDLQGTQNIEKLHLYKCVELVELYIPVECLKLVSIYINGSKLRTLDFRGTSNIEKLDLCMCVDLVELYIPVECLNLVSIYINGSKLRTLDLRGTPNIEKLDLRKCVELVELYIPVECLNLLSININGSKLRTLDLRRTPNIEKLHLDECVDLEELYIPFECLKLVSIYINVPKLRTLDLQGTPNIKDLDLYKCVNLVELHIPVECLKLVSINIYDSKLRTLDLRGAPNIEKLDLYLCVEFVELHIPVKCLQLVSINIYGSKLRTLDFRGTPSIEKLNLHKCVDLVELHIPVECLYLLSININGSKLRTLDLQGTPNIEKLDLYQCVDLVELHIPSNVYNLYPSTSMTLDLRGTSNIEKLDLYKCVDLVELHIPAECLKLVSINISGSKLRTLDLRGTPNIEKLHLHKCFDLVELDIPVECLKLVSIYINGSKLRTLDLRGTPNIVELDLQGCNDLVEHHILVECLKLLSINILGSKLRTLDLRGTPNIVELDLYRCVDLVELHIHDECLKLESINIMGAKLRTFNLGRTPKLKVLSVIECYHLLELQANEGCLKELDHLDLSNSVRFKSFLFRKPFDLVEVGCVSELHLIAESIDMCPLHLGNNFPKFRFECFYAEHGPSLIGNLEKLISFGLGACTNLERFSRSICGLQCLTKLRLEGSIPETPKDLDQLECLKELYLLSTKITHLPGSICFLKHLKCLELNHCWILEKLPEDLGRLECLEKLILLECVLLRDIPDSICKMKRLRYFHLKYCFAVEKLPEEFNRLTCLEELNIEGTGITQLPQSIFMLKGLRIIAYIRLLLLCGFTSEIQLSEDESFCYI